MSSNTLLIATTNLGKLAEVRFVLSPLDMQITCLADHPPCDEPVEDANTFEGNARIKAEYYAAYCGGWVVADDSGLEVDALDLQPGVHSARFAGTARDDDANNQKLISLLHNVDPADRTARYRCVMALANHDGVQAVTHGCLEGVIQDTPLGSNGFGYDPHFFVPDEGLTAAELDPSHKNQISHRGKALKQLVPIIDRLVVQAT